MFDITSEENQRALHYLSWTFDNKFYDPEFVERISGIVEERFDGLEAGLIDPKIDRRDIVTLVRDNILPELMHVRSAVNAIKSGQDYNPLQVKVSTIYLLMAFNCLEGHDTNYLLGG